MAELAAALVVTAATWGVAHLGRRVIRALLDAGHQMQRALAEAEDRSRDQSRRRREATNRRHLSAVRDKQRSVANHNDV